MAERDDHPGIKEAALAESELVEKTNELAAFSRYLQQLHRLSTTNYKHTDDLFVDYLRTGCQIFGVTNGIIAENDGGRLLARAVHGSMPSALADPHLRRVIREKTTVSCSAAQHTDRGNEFYIGTPILTGDRVYGVIGFWSTQETRTRELHPQAKEMIELMAKSVAVAVHQRALTDQLAYQANHDALTGLPNRLLLAERLQSALHNSDASGRGVAVAFIDLDRFKQINDTLGHTVGDAVLQQIARRLAACLDSEDTLARMGGDEFMAIFTGLAEAEQAIALARQLLTAVRAPCRVQQQELFVTASIGLSFYPQDGADAATLLKHADNAMYAAKYSGKNEVRCYQRGAAEKAIPRLEIEAHLRGAADRGELIVCYQPQVDLSRRIAGLEVLLVWDHPEFGRISPGEFIPIAEETGLIVPIGTWVVRQACRQLAEWIHRGIPIVPVSVNVSALQLTQTDLVSTINTILRESGLPANVLELELTESLVMRDVAESVAIMRELRALGVKIAIDDFGTGYSSLSYLRRLPADTLKIDRSFLAKEDPPESTLPVLRAIAVLGHALGLMVIAEGVEDEEQLELIRQAGCDRAQGHLFGGPLGPDAVEPRLAGNR